MTAELFWKFFSALTASALLVWLTLQVSVHTSTGLDGPGTGRKLHVAPTPRVGGVGIIIAWAATLALFKRLGYPIDLALMLLVSVLPVFIAGAIEDLTGRVGVSMRYCSAIFAALLGFAMTGARLHRVDLPLFDAALAIPAVSLLFSIFATAGIAHAMNLIDGCNGLCGISSVIGFAGIWFVAGLVGDHDIAAAAAIATGLWSGFLLLNFPKGRIFLGDGGAYMAGFVLAQLSILLVTRNPSVSAWFPCLLLLYPIWETLFTVYRRISLQGVSLTQPDSLHLHQLVYRRVIRLRSADGHAGDAWMRSSVTTIFMIGILLLPAVPALLFWDRTGVLLACAGVYVIFHNVFYARLTRFRSPFILSLPWLAGRAPVAEPENVLDES